MRKIPPNDIGFTNYHEYVDSMGGRMLEAELKKAGVPFEMIPVPHLVGVNASAALLLYTSPITGRPVTVLCIHDRYEIDDFAIQYYYVDGMTKEQALKDEQFWLDFYEKAQLLKA